ncbi:alpha/beta hydrolase [Patescibacteria group bacterium]|nr:alpha/beta hydrolase [Patescibacteria group bacterium]
MTNLLKGTIILLHGWTVGDISHNPEFLPDSPENWMGWAKQELEKLDYSVTTPFFRYGYKSEYSQWKQEIDKLDINESTVLVGWSSGGAFWVRWLGETKRKIKRLILVAPAKTVGNPVHFTVELPEGLDIWKRFHDFSTDPTIKDGITDITIFVSDDLDWLVKSSELYAEELAARLIRIEDQGHFLPNQRPGPAFPELLEALTKS